MTRAEIKEKSKKQIKGHIWMFFLITIVVMALSCVSYIPILGAIALILFMPFITINVYRIYQQFAVLNVAPKVEALFADFNKMWGKSWILIFMMGLFVFLWSLLLVIPGIIKGLSYAAAPYILAANPELSGPEALNESKKKMHGNKMDLFVFYLSFIGWGLLVIPTFGLLLIWLIPYMSTAEANFFANLGIVPVEQKTEKAPEPKKNEEKVEPVKEVVEEELPVETEEEQPPEEE